MACDKTRDHAGGAGSSHIYSRRPDPGTTDTATRDKATMNDLRDELSSGSGISCVFTENDAPA